MVWWLLVAAVRPYWAPSLLEKLNVDDVRIYVSSALRMHQVYLLKVMLTVTQGTPPSKGKSDLKLSFYTIFFLYHLTPLKFSASLKRFVQIG